MIHEVSSPVRGVAHLPAFPEVTQLLRVNADVPEPGVMPSAHASGTVDKIHLALGRGPLLWRREKHCSKTYSKTHHTSRLRQYQFSLQGPPIYESKGHIPPPPLLQREPSQMLHYYLYSLAPKNYLAMGTKTSCCLCSHHAQDVAPFLIKTAQTESGTTSLS